jgi:hypoxanthine phosphoribosyltransferase
MLEQPKVSFVAVTKEKADEMILKLSRRIALDNNKFDYIMGIENGGLNVSKPLSEMLNVPHKSIKISFYKEGNSANTTPDIDLHGHVFNQKDRVLVVDDLIDNGHTMKYFQDKFPCKSKIAVLYWNKYGKYHVVPDYFIEEKFVHTWLEFHWEKK